MYDRFKPKSKERMERLTALVPWQQGGKCHLFLRKLRRNYKKINRKPM